jgi:hypothetical protein
MYQIRQWLDYVDRNGSEARRLRSEGGLGLPEIRAKNWRIVLVGRTEDRGADVVQLRRQLEGDERIMLRSCDWQPDRIRAVVADPTWDHLPCGVIRFGAAELDEHRQLCHEAEAADIYPDGFESVPARSPLRKRRGREGGYRCRPRRC